jgi:hypothetical protein
LVKLLQVVLGARLLGHNLVILGEDLFEVVLRLDGVLPQAEKPVVCGLVEHDRQVVSHDVFTSAYSSHGNLVMS